MKAIGKWRFINERTDMLYRNGAHDDFEAATAEIGNGASRGTKLDGSTYHVNHNCWAFEKYKDDKPELAASQKVEWDGAGNPPAGCICEGLYDSERKEWFRVRIIGHDDGAVIARWLEGKKAYCLLDYSSPKGSFRPLRSEADKKRETAVEAMTGLWNANTKMHCEAIYDAIKSGQIVIE